MHPVEKFVQYCLLGICVICSPAIIVFMVLLSPFFVIGWLAQKIAPKTVSRLY